MSTTAEKQFIGSLKPGKFHTGETHLKMYLSGEDLKALIELGKAKGPGTWTTDEGKTLIKLEIKTGKSGKPYCEVDTWQPENTQTEQLPPSEDPDDLPF